MTGRQIRSLQHIDRSLLSQWYEDPTEYYPYRYASTVTTRRCPWQCPFCAHVDDSHKAILMPVEEIVDDFKTLVDDYNVERIAIFDP